MANAMLDETFKSSHPDLMACDAGEHDYALALTSGPNNSNVGTADAGPRTALVSSLSTSSRRGAPLQSICKSSFSSRLQLEASNIPLKDVSPSRKKSVDFALEHRQHHSSAENAAAAAAAHPSSNPSALGPPPPKRARRGEPWSPKQVVDGA